ncbi:hypothetical protein [Microbulbifer sp. TB1203]|uniref:hypothetical protein n=1 Tax=Microbulbifer sp. TB1203 TaxID=3021712 RepID=UPI0027E588C4|nr:hypothetical protein [Microbulbifer sp. TB1203]
MSKVIWHPITESPREGHTCVVELNEFGVRKIDTGDVYVIADYHYCDGTYLWMTRQGYIPSKWIGRWFPITYED